MLSFRSVVVGWKAARCFCASLRFSSFLPRAFEEAEVFNRWNVRRVVTFLLSAFSCPTLCSEGELVEFSDANSTILFKNISDKPAGCFCFSASGRVCQTRDRNISSLNRILKRFKTENLTEKRALLTSEFDSFPALELVLPVADLSPSNFYFCSSKHRLHCRSGS